MDRPEDKAKHRYVTAAFKQYHDQIPYIYIQYLISMEDIFKAEYIAKICYKYLPVDFNRK